MKPLPNELLDCVIENLYSDIPSLLSCALVGRAWVHSSQRGIFRNIVLSLPPPRVPGYVANDFVMGLRDAYRNTIRKLVASFDSTPRLASYVQFLELHHRFHLDGNLDELHDATVNVIQRLSTLNHLKFREIHWCFLSSMLRAALAELFRTPSLTEVTFLGLYNMSLAEVTSLLNQMPRQLKALHLLSIFLNGLVEMEQVDLPPKSIQLETLTMSDCHADSFLDWFLKDTCLFEIRNLQSLNINQYEGRDMDRHLHSVGRNLRELALDISSVSNDCLTYMPNLRILHLRGIALKSPFSVQMSRTILESLFNPDGNRSSLRHLKIDLFVGDIFQLVTHLDQWAQIDELLNRPELSGLERVDVIMMNLTHSDLSGAKDLLRGKFPILEASGKLYIHHGSSHS